MLGSGAFGYVFKAQVFGNTVAFKLIDPSRKEMKEVEKDIFWKEVRMLYLVEHPRFVKLLGVAVEEKNFGIISEFVPGRTMDVILLERRIEVWVSMIWILELLEGMVWLSSQGIVHRDLKPCNLIISDSRGLVIINLGMSAVTKWH